MGEAPRSVQGISVPVNWTKGEDVKVVFSERERERDEYRWRFG